MATTIKVHHEGTGKVLFSLTEPNPIPRRGDYVHYGNCGESWLVVSVYFDYQKTGTIIHVFVKTPETLEERLKI